MKKVIKQAFLSTLPVMAGYIVLGFGFGIILKTNGHGVLLAFAMSFLIYAGSMQYVALELLSSGASYIVITLTTIMVNARHLFYGVSMLDRYRETGARKPYLIFSLTDETYSLLCAELPELPEGRRTDYFFAVSLLDQSYWILGSVLGALVGTVVHFNAEGIDFALTALFLTVFVDQWRSTKNHFPALVGVVASLLCLIVFGADSFLIPAMLLIAPVLCLYKEGKKNA